MVSLLISLVLLAQERGVEMNIKEGTERAFPEIRNAEGEKIGAANVIRWVNGSQLHVRSQARLTDGRTITERATFDVGDRLVQRDWSWTEERLGRVQRKFAVDMKTGNATVIVDGRRSQRRLEGTQGAFAGLGFAFAARNLADRLASGEDVELVAVGFTPRPRVSKVVLRAQDDVIKEGSKSVEALRVTIHPTLPRFLLSLLNVPDQIVWISKSRSPELLRAWMSMGEPSDPMVLVDAM